MNAGSIYRWLLALASLSVGVMMFGWALTRVPPRPAPEDTVLRSATSVPFQQPAAADRSAELVAGSADSYGGPALTTVDARGDRSLGANVRSAPEAIGAAPSSPCRIYPIALHTSSLESVNPGAIIHDIYNGYGRGNFGWLSWTGDTSEGSLASSLTPPGNAETYTNPNNSADHALSAGDWVAGRPGVSDTSSIRNALNRLKTNNSYVMIVPLWDVAEGSGSNVKYHIVDLIAVNLISYELPNQNRITAKYIGRGCPPPPPPPVSIDDHLYVHSRYDRATSSSSANTVYLSTDGSITWPHGEVLYWSPSFDIHVPPSSDNAYTYRLRIIAWSYVRTENGDGSWSYDAATPDVLGRSGCRSGPAPATDPSGLDGCAYAYTAESNQPQVSEMLQSFWSVHKPLSLDNTVYTYQLQRLEPVYMVTQVKYAIDVMSAYDPNGVPVIEGSPQFATQRFTVNLVTPRSVR